MGNLTYVFERVERKFLLTPSQYEGLMRVLPEYMQADQYGESTILSLYLDTADSLLIRRSLEKPVYKEKLRLRSYGVPGDGDNVFLEMKKKVQGVVYKRRICLPLDRAMECLARESIPAAGGQTDLDLRLGAAGESLLAPGMRLMEIKTAHAIPLWLCAALDQNEIRPTSFSKYGRVYEARMRAGQARAMRPAAVKGGIADAVCHV